MHISSGKKGFRLVYCDLFYKHSNDNSPFDDLRPINKQHRDDNGLTFSLGFENNTVFELKNGAQLSFNLSNLNVNYTKALGSTTALHPGDADYSFFEYILKLHPDWDAVYLNNLNSISKYYNRLIISYKKKNIRYCFGMGDVVIDAGRNQFMSTLQRNYHKEFVKLLKNRNYYESDVTQNKLNGARVQYNFVHAAIYFEKDVSLADKKIDLKVRAGAGININLVKNDQVPVYMPFFDSNVDLEILKTKVPNKKRLVWKNRLYLDPNEILPLAADPGSIGYYTSALRLNFNARKRYTNIYKKYNLQYFIVPYEINIPLNGKHSNDNVAGYLRPSHDKGIIESYVYGGVCLMLK